MYRKNRTFKKGRNAQIFQHLNISILSFHYSHSFVFAFLLSFGRFSKVLCGGLFLSILLGGFGVQASAVPAANGLPEGASPNWVYTSLKGGFSKSAKNPSDSAVQASHENIFLRSRGLSSDTNYTLDPSSSSVYVVSGKVGVGTSTPLHLLTVQAPQNIFSLSALSGNSGIVFSDAAAAPHTAQVFLENSNNTSALTFQNNTNTIQMFPGGDTAISSRTTVSQGYDAKEVITGTKTCPASSYIVGVSQGAVGGDVVCAPAPPVIDNRCRYKNTNTPFGKNCVFTNSSCEPVIVPVCTFSTIATGKPENGIGSCFMYEAPPAPSCKAPAPIIVPPVTPAICEVSDTETGLPKNHADQCTLP